MESGSKKQRVAIRYVVDFKKNLEFLRKLENPAADFVVFPKLSSLLTETDEKQAFFILSFAKKSLAKGGIGIGEGKSSLGELVVEYCCDGQVVAVSENGILALFVVSIDPAVISKLSLQLPEKLVALFAYPEILEQLKAKIAASYYVQFSEQKCGENERSSFSFRESDLSKSPVSFCVSL